MTVVGSAASESGAQWSSDPAAPVVVGQAEGSFGPRVSAAATSDGAVWLAWQDSFCGGFDGGSVRLQRIAPGAQLLSPSGIAVSPDVTCGFVLPPQLEAVGASVTVGRALSGLDAEPLQRFDLGGQSEWGAGYATPSTYTLGSVTTLPNGDTIVISTAWDMIRAERIDASGARVWAEPLEFSSDTGANFRIIDVIPNDQGGAIVVWDSPAFAYTRLILARGITPEGQADWASSVRLVETPHDVTSSRHSDPVAISDGQGGAIIIFASGFESASTPAPLLMQRVGPDGVPAFPLSGSRVALGAERQFDPIAIREPTSGDVFVVWRDGLPGGQTLRAQRLSVLGDRLWTDVGVEVSGIVAQDSFDATYESGRLAIVIASDSGVSLDTLDPNGAPWAAQAMVVSNAASESVRVTPSADGFVVSAQQVGAQSGLVIAQRVNRGGRLGDPGCNAADMSTPIGALDFSDVAAFISAFALNGEGADLSAPFGALDFSDVVAFLDAFGAGCP